MQPTNWQALARRGRGDRGAQLIEFALTFPLMLMVVLGIVDFAFVFHHNEVVTNAAREGARIGTLPGYGTTDVENRVNAYLVAGGLPGTPAVTVTGTTVPVGGGFWPATSVGVTYNYDYMFVGAVASWFGDAFSSVTIKAQATMRNELGP